MKIERLVIHRPTLLGTLREQKLQTFGVICDVFGKIEQLLWPSGHFVI